MTPFHVGMKVVCVDDSPSTHRTDEIYPVKGEVYTIREFTNFTQPAMRLVEIVNKPKHYFPQFAEVAFVLRRFRPIVKTDISIFEAMLAPSPKQRVDA